MTNSAACRAGLILLNQQQICSKQTLPVVDVPTLDHTGTLRQHYRRGVPRSVRRRMRVMRGIDRGGGGRQEGVRGMTVLHHQDRCYCVYRREREIMKIEHGERAFPG
jgi:hypothetical protein